MTGLAFTETVRAYVRGSGGYYPFTGANWAALRTAWEAGKTFYTGQMIDGEEMTIKLAEIEALMFCTVDSQEVEVARQKAEAKAREPESFA